MGNRMQRQKDGLIISVIVLRSKAPCSLVATVFRLTLW